MKTPVNSQNALINFYGIEAALRDAFTLCAYIPRNKHLAVFFLAEPDTPLGHELKTATPFDTDRARRAIIDINPPLRHDPPRIVFYDLSTWQANLALAKIMGLSDADNVNDPSCSSTYPHRLRPVCDTDQDYDPFRKHPYLAGYNSTNYDTTMLALYLTQAFSPLGQATQQSQPLNHDFTAPVPQQLRAWNDELFREPWKSYMPRFLTEGPPANGQGRDSTPHRIRQAMLSSGRHIDVARLNEAQQRAPLKRLLAGLGHQIKENDKLRAHNPLSNIDELYELLAYNVSDVVGLAHLFADPTYSAGFDLKKGLLDQYPETLYQPRNGSYEPDLRPERVRKDRLTPDSSSARFVGRILAPYHPLKDLKGVSYLYPSEQVARARGIEQVDVLEEARRFFYSNITDRDARDQFDHVYTHYKQIRGQNFNDSEAYDKTWGLARHRPHQLKNLPKAPNLPYFHANGQPSSCFVAFSIGGIHGAEANLALFEQDMRAWRAQDEMLRRAKQAYPRAGDLVDALVEEHNRVARPDCSVVGQASDPAVASWHNKEDAPAPAGRLARATRAPDASPGELLARMCSGDQALHVRLDDGFMVEGTAVLDHQGQSYVPATRPPELFEPRADGSTKLNTRYVYTSAEAVIHEDFTSYYPVLLRNLSAFDNPELGEDRYARLYADKESYDRQLNDPDLAPSTRQHLQVLREGTKLILNTASGAGDTQFATPIRMNNQIISMRIIGQLLSWRIGQAQTLAGARIVSTNTDGLYSTLDAQTNEAVLKREAAAVGVRIESEPMVVVSKDSNNRLELAAPDPGEPLWKAPIISATGSTLASHQGPQPTKRLAHPAVLDWALARYLRYVVGGYVPPWRDEPLSLAEPLDRRLGLELMRQARSLEDPVQAARLFQHVVAASQSKLTFPFAADPLSSDAGQITNPEALQHYNRVFVVRPQVRGACSLHAAGAWEVAEASRVKRKRTGQGPTVTEPVALGVLQAHGFARTRFEAYQHGRTLLPVDRDVAVRRVPGLDPAWRVVIENGDLLCASGERLSDLLGCLDLDVYVQMLASCFDRNWKR